MKSVKGFFLESMIQTKSYWGMVSANPQLRRARMVLFLGLLMIVASPSYAQVVTDVESNPFVQAAVGIAQIITQGLAGVFVIYGGAKLGMSYMSSDGHGRSGGWKALAAGAGMIVLVPAAKWIIAFWQANQTGVVTPYFG